MQTAEERQNERQKMRDQLKANEAQVQALSTGLATLLHTAAMCSAAASLDRAGKLALREQIESEIRRGAAEAGVAAEIDTDYPVDPNYVFTWMSCQSCLITAIQLLDRARVALEILALPPTDRDFVMPFGEASHWITGALHSATGRDWDPA